MPFDMSVQQLAAIICAFLLGALIDAVIAGFLLVRAERRNKELRRRIAQLAWTSASGSAQTRGTSNGAEGFPEHQQPQRSAPASTESRAKPSTIPPRQPEEPRFPEPPAPFRAEPAPWEPEEDADAFADVPTLPSTSWGNRPAHPQHDTAEKPVPQPDARQETEFQPESFASVEAEEKFQRDYRDPMEDARKRIAQLRSQINTVSHEN